MGMFSSVIDRLALGRAASIMRRSEMLPGVRPPMRNASAVTPDSAASLHSVYRAIEIILNSGAQISVDSKRRGQIIDDVPALLRRPNLNIERDDFIEDSIMSLIVDGNLFWLKNEANGQTIELEVLNPYLVGVNTDKNGRKFFRYGGKEYSTSQIIHRTRFKLPGQLRGRSVMQAAAADLGAAIQVRDFAANVFDDDRIIDGILASDQAVTADDARTANALFNLRNPETGEPLDYPFETNTRVLGKGFSYESITINPKDAQWIESQGFNVTVIARMFGVPASLMLAALEGNSQTYSNVEQDWLAFVRFTLSGYLRKIESAWTEVLPHGQTAKFNIEALLRSDTMTRYQANNIALGRWMGVNEIRAIENLPLLTDEEIEALAKIPAAPSAPTPVESKK